MGLAFHDRKMSQQRGLFNTGMVSVAALENIFLESFTHTTKVDLPFVDDLLWFLLKPWEFTIQAPQCYVAWFSSANIRVLTATRPWALLWLNSCHISLSSLLLSASDLPLNKWHFHPHSHPYQKPRNNLWFLILPHYSLSMNPQSLSFYLQNTSGTCSFLSSAPSWLQPLVSLRWIPAIVSMISLLPSLTFSNPSHKHGPHCPI